MNIDYDSYMETIKSTKRWDELGSYRKKAERQRIYAWFIGFGILIIGGIALLMGEFFSALSAPVVAVCIVIFLYKKTHKDYSKKCKGVVVPKLLTDVINSYSVSGGKTVASYNAKQHINFNTLLGIPLFKNYKHKRIHYEGEDLFVGKLGETSFQFSDFVIQRNRDIPLADQDINLKVFKGLVLIADFHKAFEGTTTLITRKGNVYKHQSFIGSRMNTISYEFDRMFKVFTTDEITARYLLPVNMLERIVKLRGMIPGEGMALCLHEGQLVISLHNVDLFETDGLKQLNKKTLHRISQEIKAILDIIDLLNLNLRLWNKQAKKPKSSGR